MNEEVKIVINKKERKLQLWNGDILENEFDIGLGFTPEGKKDKEGDGKTPEGQYFVCTRNEQSKFTLFLGINYPNGQDATEAYKKGDITKDVCEDIIKAEEEGKRPDWHTSLGGEVGIHGKGGHFDWTGGCIALDDEDIKTLWEKTDYHTKVEIY